MKQIFLGGTCGSNNWRKDIVIPGLLQRGVQSYHIIDPVVTSWTPEAQKHEDFLKADPETVLLFVLASPAGSTVEDNTSVSGYSIAEAVMALYECPKRTLVMFDNTGFAKRTMKGNQKMKADLQQRFPVQICESYEELILRAAHLVG